MRIIAGSARSTPLITPAGKDTRPTTDRIKETLFNMLHFSLEGRPFLDLFAGSGAMGLEAVSRGASRSVLIDMDRRAADCIRKNIAKCHFEDRTELLQTDVSAGLLRLKGREDLKSPIVFMDPPYDAGLEWPVLKLLPSLGLLDEDSIVIVETSLSGDLSGAEELGYKVLREKRYKNQKHVFLGLEELENGDSNLSGKL
ncbi:MAG: 16S rRNA (guanine(966)-N(2))-methyltransferase RsmD [Eubacteriales bacterium]|nr:16S rRNA (guanine(966)-N(2))-methyltransferase RsmD [Eubacteriales bacterium]